METRMKLYGHQVNIVYHYEVLDLYNFRPIILSYFKVKTNLFHCVVCKFMGNEQTFKEYSCETSHTDAD